MGAVIVSFENYIHTNMYAYSVQKCTMYIVQSMELSVTAIHARKSQIYKCITWATDS